MIKFAALNATEDDSSGSSRQTKEVVESDAFQKYNKALTFIKNKEYEQAKKSLTDLLLHSYFNFDDETFSGSDFFNDPAVKLLTSIYKNLGIVHENTSCYDEALDCYLEAVSSDKSDITTWYNIAKVAIKKVNYTLACDSLKECLKINPSFWPSIDTLICLSYALGDYLSCLHLIQHSLSLNINFQRALCVKAQIESEDPLLFKNFSWKQGLADLKPEQASADKEMEYPKELREKDHQAKKQTQAVKTEPILYLRELSMNDSLADLGVAICELFAKSKEEDLSLFCPVDFSKSNLEAVLKKESESVEMADEAAANMPKEETVDQPETKETTVKDPSGDETDIKLAKELEAKERREGQRRSKRVQDLQTENNDPVESLVSQLKSWIPDKLKHDEGSMTVSQPSTTKSGETNDVRAPTLVDETELIRKITDVSDTPVLLVPLMKTYCNQLAGHYHNKWSRQVIKSVLNVYFSYREYEALPNILQSFVEHDTEENVLTLMCVFEIIVNYDLFPGVSTDYKCFKDLRSVITEGALDKDQEFLRTANQHERIKEMFSSSSSYDLFQLRYAWVYCLYEEKLGNVKCSLEFAKMCLSTLKSSVIDELIIANNNIPFINEKALEEQKQDLEEVQERENVSNLFKEKNYSRVVELLKPMLNEDDRDVIKTDYSQIPIRHKNLLMLLESLRKVSMNELCLKCAELLLDELVPFLRFTDTCKSLLTKILKSFTTSMLECDMKSSIISYSRAMNNIVKVLVKFFETQAKEETVHASLADYPIERAFMAYHMIIDKFDYKILSETEQMSVNASRIQSLAMSHEILGENNICSLSNGIFLSYIIDCCNYYKAKNIFIEDATDLLEQAVFCYIAHPGPGSKRSKKNRIEHGSSNVRVTLDIACSIYRFYAPRELFSPMEKTKHVSADTLDLFKQIIGLFKEDLKKTEVFLQIKQFMENGKIHSHKGVEITEEMKNFEDIFYLCGDYLWKYGEFTQAIDCFVCDLVIHPDRLQSWLLLGLCWLSIAEDRFNQAKSDLKVVIESIAPKAVLCFDYYMASSSTSFSVASEYSIFLYTIASVYNQVAGVLADNIAVIKEIDLKRLTLITKSKEVLLKGIEPTSPSVWIKYFMLAKITEKLNCKDLAWLDIYLKCLDELDEYKGVLGKKINTSAPVEYSMELIEIVFRISYSMYKRTTEYPDILKNQTKKQKIVSCLKRIQGLLSLPVTTDDNVNVSKEVYALLEESFARWPENYKIRNALCKMIHDSASPNSDDYLKAKSLMLQDTSNSSGMFLFTRKHLFLGIWRIPVDTVDRPGGFFRHMRKSLSLIIASLTHCKDISNLIKLFENMVKTADQLNNFVGDVTPFLQTTLTQFDTLLRTRVSEYCGAPAKHSTEHSIKLLQLCLKVKNVHVKSAVETKPVDEAILVVLKLFKLTVPQQIAICNPRILEDQNNLYDIANRLIADFEQVAAFIELEKQKRKEQESAGPSKPAQNVCSTELTPTTITTTTPATQPPKTSTNVIQSDKIVVGDAAKSAVRHAVATFITQMAEKNSSKPKANVSQILNMINDSVKSKENSAKIREILLKAVSKPHQQTLSPTKSVASATSSVSTCESSISSAPVLCTPPIVLRPPENHSETTKVTPTSINTNDASKDLTNNSIPQPDPVNNGTSAEPPTIPVATTSTPATLEKAKSLSQSVSLNNVNVNNNHQPSDKNAAPSRIDKDSTEPHTEKEVRDSVTKAPTPPPKTQSPVPAPPAPPQKTALSNSPKPTSDVQNKSSSSNMADDDSDSDDEDAMPSLDDVPAPEPVITKSNNHQNTFKNMPNLNIAQVSGDKGHPPGLPGALPMLHPPMLVKKEPSTSINTSSFIGSPPPMYCRSSSVPEAMGMNGNKPSHYYQHPMDRNKMMLSKFMHDSTATATEGTKLALTPAQLMALNVPSKKEKPPKKPKAPRKKKLKEAGVLKKREKKRKIDKVQTLKQFDFPQVEKAPDTPDMYFSKPEIGLDAHAFRRGISEINPPSVNPDQSAFFRQNSEPILPLQRHGFAGNVMNPGMSDEMQYKAEDFFAGTSGTPLVDSPVKSGFLSDSPYNSQSSLLMSPSPSAESTLFSPTSSENMSTDHLIMDEDSQLENVDLGILNELDSCDLTEEQEKLMQVVPKPKRGRKPKDPNKPRAPPKRRKKKKAQPQNLPPMNGMAYGGLPPGASPFTSPPQHPGYPYPKTDSQFPAGTMPDDNSPNKFFYYQPPPPDGSVFPPNNPAEIPMMPPTLQPHTVQQPTQLDQLQSCSNVIPTNQPPPHGCQYSTESAVFARSSPVTAGPLTHYSPDAPKLGYPPPQIQGYPPVTAVYDNMYPRASPAGVIKQDPLEHTGLIKDETPDQQSVAVSHSMDFAQYPVTQSTYTADAIYPTSLYPDHSQGFNPSPQMSTAGSSMHPQPNNFNQYQNFRTF